MVGVEKTSALLQTGFIDDACPDVRPYAHHRADNFEDILMRKQYVE